MGYECKREIAIIQIGNICINIMKKHVGEKASLPKLLLSKSSGQNYQFFDQIIPHQIHRYNNKC